MRMLKEGERVIAPYKDGPDKRGVVEEVLSAMIFVRFDDNTADFYAHRDTQVRRIPSTTSA